MPASIDLPASPAVRVAYGTCAHCGAANPHGARWTAQIGGESRRFCCGGCLAVATTLEAAGLDRIDAARVRAPVEGHRPGDDDWIRWAAGARAAGLVHERADGLHETALLLDGMTCGACVVLLETWLGRQPGIAAASVNYANRRAQVRWDPEVTDLPAVLRAIAAVGYAAYPYDPARREALARRERRALLTRAAIALLAMMQVMMLAWPAYTSMDGVAPEQQRLLDWASLVLTLPVLLYCATPLFANAWRDVTRGRVGMDVPITLGIAAAFAASAWAILRGGGPVYFDSVTMFVALLLVARYCELVARQNAGAAIEAIARQRPDTAERLPAWPAATGVQTVAAATLARDDIVLVRPGRAGAGGRHRDRRPVARRGGHADRRERGASARVRRPRVGRRGQSRERARAARGGRRRSDATRRDPAPDRARGDGPAGRRPARRPHRHRVRRRAAVAGRADRAGHGGTSIRCACRRSRSPCWWCRARARSRWPRRPRSRPPPDRWRGAG